jgi:hypothetical protein
MSETWSNPSGARAPTICSIRSAGMFRQASTSSFTVSRRAASYAASPADGEPALASSYASTRASMTAWDQLFFPVGYMGWAASPSSVTRPVPQNGSGSLSTIGRSTIRSAPVIMAGMSSELGRQPANRGSTSSTRPG